MSSSRGGWTDPQSLIPDSNRSARARRFAAAVTSTPFSTDPFSVVSAWLRVGQATSDVNGVSSLPDVLNTNPAVQTVDARKPVIENSANGLPCMRFVTNDVLVWPITAQSSASDYAGWGMWIKPSSFPAVMRIIRVATGTNAASTTKLTISTSNSTLSCAAVSSATVSKTGGVLTTAWGFVTIEYSKDGATDDSKLTVTLNGTPLGTAVGSTLVGVLASATGNILIGNGNDGAANSAYQGLIGPNIYAFSSKMSGATTGILTTDARTALMNFEAPT